MEEDPLKKKGSDLELEKYSLSKFSAAYGVNLKTAVAENEQQRELQDYFLKPFNKQAVLKGYESMDKQPNRFNVFVIHDEPVAGLSYKILAEKEFNNPELVDELDYRLESIDGNKSHAEFFFRMHERNKTNYLDMTHRSVRAQELGVSGSAFLKKAEAHIKILHDAGHVPADEILVRHVFQAEVIVWLLKNKYDFADAKSADLYKELLDNQSGFIQMETGKQYAANESPALLRKAALQNPELQRYFEKEDEQALFTLGYEHFGRFPGMVPELEFKKKI
jgi:hypothetical protein